MQPKFLVCRWSSSASRWIRRIAWRGCFRFLAHCVEFQVEKLRRRKQRPKMNLFQRRWCDLSEAAVDDDDEHNEITIKRTRRKKEEDHRCRCTIELRSIYCRHALHYHTSFWYFVWFSWPLHVFPIPFLPHFGLARCRVVPVRLLPAQVIFHPQSSQSFPRRWRRRNEESCWSDLVLAKWNAWCVAWWQKIPQIFFHFLDTYFFGCGKA